MTNFNLRDFLSENNLTVNSRILKEDATERGKISYTISKELRAFKERLNITTDLVEYMDDLVSTMKKIQQRAIAERNSNKVES